MTYKIDKHVPAPKTTGGRHTKYPFASMSKGDSFFSPTKSATAAAYSYGKRHGMKFISAVEDRGCRIWRVK